MEGFVPILLPPKLEARVRLSNEYGASIVALARLQQGGGQGGPGPGRRQEERGGKSQWRFVYGPAPCEWPLLTNL